MTYGQQDAVPPPPPSPGQVPGYGTPGNQYGYGASMPGQPGYAGWSTAPAVRPGSVTAGAVLAIIGGIVAILFGALLLVLAGVVRDSSAFAGTGLTPEMFVGLGGIVAVVGVLVLVFGIMALRGRYWAAIALTITGALYVALAIVSLIGGQGSVLVGIIWIAISVSLLMSGTSRAWFRAQR
ncbi:hypothetical protein [Pseudactinotalea suaedae]|uniref:hypothetical protein n=1 Tax=Pseudactinotalea suaedae TaxID=1524924 RepID=UPI0012E1DE73|nr:hypothetical protein [Pseudactinotalea suaedae]